MGAGRLRPAAPLLPPLRVGEAGDAVFVLFRGDFAGLAPASVFLPANACAIEGLLTSSPDEHVFILSLLLSWLDAMLLTFPGE
jgi:hypothetical protein